MIKTITLECRFFSPVHLDVWDKEVYTLSEDGSMTYGSFSDGNMDEPKYSDTRKLTDTEKEEIFSKAQELACIDETIYQTLDDCSGEVTVCYDDREETVKPRGSRLYGYLADIFERHFDRQVD